MVTSSLLVDDKTLVITVKNTGTERRTLTRNAHLLNLELVEQARVSEIIAAPAGPQQTDGTPQPGILPLPLEKLLDTCEELTDGQRGQVRDVLLEFQDVFSCSGEIGHCTLVEHMIETGDAAPIKQAPRRLALSEQKKADTCIEDMLDKDVIGPSSSPWASPVVLLTKKDGKPRFAIDLRKLNRVTRKDAYPLPRIDDILDSLRGSTWFSSLDVKWGYWNIPLAADPRLHSVSPAMDSMNSKGCPLASATHRPRSKGSWRNSSHATCPVCTWTTS